MRLPPSLYTQFGDVPTSTGVSASSILDSLVKAGTAYLTLDQQRKLMDLNVKRAQQNLPPIDAANYAAGVNVGLTSNTQSMLLIAVGVIAVVWLLTSVVGRRR